MRTLSKSDFKVARTCSAKLYYREMGYPDTGDDDPYLEMLAEGGYMVELLAKQQFPEGVSLQYGRDGETDARATAELLAAGSVTLFEATLLHGGRLARVDVLRRGPGGFELFEVKSTSMDPVDMEKRLAKTRSAFRSLQKPHGISTDWREYLEDVTYQVTILKDLYPGERVRAYLIVMNKGAVAACDGMPEWFRIVRDDNGGFVRAEFVGDVARARESALTITLDVTSEVLELEAEVRAAAATFVASLTPEPRSLPGVLGPRCRDCEFRVEGTSTRNGFMECWGARGQAQPHVLELYQGRDLLAALIAEGVSGLREIEEARVAGRPGAHAARQLVQVRHSKSGEEWTDPALGTALTCARYPLQFIDFEAAGLAIPYHKGMAPYGRIAWQWSCHTQAGPDAALTHAEFINVDSSWPNLRFAETLRACLGDRGTVLTWSPFESSILRMIADEIQHQGRGQADLATWLRTVAGPLGSPGGRVMDMLALCRAHYFHPLMGRSNSIKAVLDAVWKTVPEVRERFAATTGVKGDPALGPYAALRPAVIGGRPQVVAEGTGAVRAYFAMMYGAERHDPETRELWRSLLLEYCKLDTLAMVLIWEHWMRRTGAVLGQVPGGA